MKEAVHDGTPARALTESCVALARSSAQEALNAVADAAQRSLDFTAVARRAVDVVTSYKPFSAASIFSLDEDTAALELVAGSGFSERLGARTTLPLHGSFIGLSILNRQVTTTDDIGEIGVARVGLREMAEMLAEEGFRGVVSIPLLHHDLPLGCLNIALKGDEQLNDDERETLQAVGNTVAIAMANTTLVQQLRESQRRYGLATAAAHVGVWDWNLETGSFYLDPTIKAVLGYADHEIPSDLEAWSCHVYEPDRARVQESIEEHLAGKTARFVCEHRMMHKDGTLRWIMARGYGMRNSAGEVTRMVGTDADVTDRKRLEEQHREFQEKMLRTEKLNSLGVLAGGVAHEFNNLLTGVLGCAALAHNQAPPDSPIRARIEQIEAAARRAAELTRQLLAYSGRGAFVLTSIDLSRLVSDTTELLDVSVSRKARLTYDCSLGIPRINGDAGQLQQLLLNLVVNASEALGDGAGSIVVRTQAVDVADGISIAGEAAGTLVCLEVSDTGCGMAEAVRAKIFEPFFSTKFIGRGLGLAAVDGIVRGHHGRLDVTSQPGAGTSVRVYLPALEEGER